MSGCNCVECVARIVNPDLPPDTPHWSQRCVECGTWVRTEAEVLSGYLSARLDLPSATKAHAATHGRTDDECFPSLTIEGGES